MRFTPEVFAQYIANRFFRDGVRDELALAKIEYGISIALGVLLELAAAVLISLFLGTTAFTLAVMLAALSIKYVVGGSHLTTYLRCFLFTLGYFLPFPILIKFLYLNYPPFLLLETSTVLMIILLLALFKKGIHRNTTFIVNLGLIAFLYFHPQAFWVGISLAFSVGMTLQAVSISKFGVTAIELIDNMLKKIGL